MKTIYGDLIELGLVGQFDVIAHGCNCMCVMGAGLAKQIKRKFPDVFALDRRSGVTTEKIGGINWVDHDIDGHNLTVVNAYTQVHYGHNQRQCEYGAIRECMQKIKKHFSGKRIGLPKIGAGLGGGDWNLIREIIEHELAGEDVTFVYYR
jgi:O-acetyl-ADP-ribose deacetylase (regulator of RNase III)